MNNNNEVRITSVMNYSFNYSKALHSKNRPNMLNKGRTAKL